MCVQDSNRCCSAFHLAEMKHSMSYLLCMTATAMPCCMIACTGLLLLLLLVPLHRPTTSSCSRHTTCKAFQVVCLLQVGGVLLQWFANLSCSYCSLKCIRNFQHRCIHMPEQAGCIRLWQRVCPDICCKGGFVLQNGIAKVLLLLLLHQAPC